MKRGFIIAITAILGLVLTRIAVEYFDLDVDYVLLAYLLTWRLDDTLKK